MGSEPAPVTDGNIVVLRNLSKTYRKGRVDVHALHGVTVEIERGSHVAIMGPSGSGKTTLLNIMGGLEPPSSGECLVDGRDLTRLDDSQLCVFRNRFVGFVFQAYNLLPDRVAWRNVELPLVYAGVAPAERRRRALDALAAVGLAHRADHLPSEMSGGEEQRVAIARALAVRPRLILADEPTGNLDSAAQADVLECFSSLNRTGATVVVVTHNPAVAERANRIVRLTDGRVVA
jgi:putative ABC transport system ATP-binding protein